MTRTERVARAELRACPNPWCGRQFLPNAIRWPVTANKTTQWAVHCDDCDLYGPVGDTEAEAIERWNDRPALTAIDEERDALREALAALRSHPKIAGCRPLASGELRSLFDNADAALARSLSSVSREEN